MTPIDLEDRVRRTFQTVVPTLVGDHIDPAPRVAVLGDTIAPDEPDPAEAEYVDVPIRWSIVANGDRASQVRRLGRLLAAAAVLIAVATGTLVATRRTDRRAPATPPTVPTVTAPSVPSTLPVPETAAGANESHWLPAREIGRAHV